MPKNQIIDQSLQYDSTATQKVASFVASVKNQAEDGATVFDSAQSLSDLSYLPEKLQVVLDEADSNGPKIMKAVYDGIRIYEQTNGISVPADVVEQAIHSAWTTTENCKAKLDSVSAASASSTVAEPLSLQPNRAVIAVLGTISEAIPVAHYLPADIGSNEAKLAIFKHVAGSNNGAYSIGDSLDGAISGQSYMTASRFHTVNTDSEGKAGGKITSIQTDVATCDQGANGASLLNGRLIVYIKGLPVAREVKSNATKNSIVGSFNIEGTTYTINGWVEPIKGTFEITTAPALDSAWPITVEGILDFDANASLIPVINTRVDTYSLFASAWRAQVKHGIESRTQVENELGIDMHGENVLAINAQFANERHYQVLAYAYRIGQGDAQNYNLDYIRRSSEMNRSQMWVDFAAFLGELSQKMANRTIDHGITHLYVGDAMKANIESMSRDYFSPSGLAERPGIYRIGRLFGKYDVYYAPRIIKETGTSAQILAIGKSNNVARNPFVLGDAVAPILREQPTDAMLGGGAAFYARNFTSVNPDELSAKACTVINITNYR